jgi:hypothetical protein
VKLRKDLRVLAMEKCFGELKALDAGLRISGMTVKNDV